MAQFSGDCRKLVFPSTSGDLPRRFLWCSLLQALMSSAPLDSTKETKGPNLLFALTWKPHPPLFLSPENWLRCSFGKWQERTAEVCAN